MDVTENEESDLILELPDELWVVIIGLAGIKAVPSLSSVSKQWNAFYASDEIWKILWLTDLEHRIFISQKLQAEKEQALKGQIPWKNFFMQNYSIVWNNTVNLETAAYSADQKTVSKIDHMRYTDATVALIGHPIKNGKIYAEIFIQNASDETFIGITNDSHNFQRVTGNKY
eukprot:TRINITY_DN9368_c0_g1_i2.p1 TRINITY_DN9368_c0_g1~~TRINITY_DN9368_c0_g1_i2.p1  ORF type:complete len:179 (-),score=19.71 TRINITY_DN9368_c0_g1_i2:79-594(-)